MFNLASLISRLGRLPRVFTQERGAALIYVTLTLPVLVGLGLLAVDGARVFNLGTELQKGADALALAAAAELDGRAGAQARADAAIANMLENEQRFANGTRAVYNPTQVTRRFLTSLPADDAAVIDGTYVAANGADAVTRFIEVTVGPSSAPRILTAILPASFIGGSMTVRSGAVAVAGFTSVVCKTMPMFICNPFEGTGTSIFDPAALGRQIKMQTQGGGDSQYFPGNYGWLDTPDFQDNGGSGNGAQNLRNALASVQPPVCFEQNGVTVRTGNIENANDAINVRFDLWAGPFNNSRNDANYRPAQNVRKGYSPGNGQNGACNPNQDPTNGATNFGRLPRDGSFPDSTNRLGDGNWDFDNYWAANYGGFASPPVVNGVAWSNTNRPSRYQVYRHELSTMGTGTDLVNRTSDPPYGETGRPMCQGNTGLSDDPDRRLIFAAIINCNGVNINGNSSQPLPVLAFGKFFLTEPVPNPPLAEAGTVFSEFVEAIGPGNVDKTVARDQVQLYR